MAEGVSIVLRSCHEEERLRTTLTRLENQTGTRVPWEVLLIADASMGKIARFALSSCENGMTRLRILDAEKPGSQRAWEQKLKEAKYGVLAFIDDSNWLAPNWVQVASETFASDPALGALGSICEPVFAVSVPMWFDQFHSIYGILTALDFQQRKAPFEYLNEAGLCVRKQAWTQLIQGGFRSLFRQIDRQVPVSDLSELSLAIRLAGWKMRVEPRLQLQQWIPAEHLNWRYLRRLHRYHEAVRVLLDAYSIQNLSMRLSLRSQAAQMWWYQIGKSMTILARRPQAILAAVTSKKEGRQDVVEIEMLIGRILEMLRLRGRYGWSRRHIRYAPWRLRGLEEYLRQPREAHV